MSTPTSNKVKYGLKNVYYAVYDEDADTYNTPVAIPGAVNMSLDAEGDTTTFRADNTDYYVSVSNNGYSGDFEAALIPDSFLQDVMGEVVDATTGLQYEVADAQPKYFALLFEFDGDRKKTRHVMYHCKASRTSVSSQTTEKSIEPVTDKLSLTATARPSDNIVKAKTYHGDTNYATFFAAVIVPTAAAAAAQESNSGTNSGTNSGSGTGTESGSGTGTGTGG